MNNDELIAAGHELAKCLDNEPLLDIAKMIVRLVDKLEVTTLALREKTKQCEQVAQAVGWVDGGNFTLAEAVAGHVSGLKAAAQLSEELAAENAMLKNQCPNPHSVSMFEAIEKAEQLMDEGMPELAMVEAFEILKIKRTPATDAFIAEQRAQGVEMLADHLSGLGISASETSVREFAAQLRQGGAA
ncbi:hypothetical protein [Cronobacter dublinensis]|uniref:hypothetical protein n=1 Tax=Cronobacter dublinensis TaxID=413497 RepID=UPI000CFAACAF|nr:hypothetical protein [Cronobacter dublinensis]